MRRLRNGSVVVVAALALLFPGTANATEVNAAGHVYKSNEDCAFVHAHMDNSQGRPMTWTYASMDWFGSYPCQATNALARAGTLSTGWDLLYFNGSNWQYCKTSPWYYNQSTTHDMMVTAGWYRPCGSALYILNGYGRTWNGVWHGGFNQTDLRGLPSG